MTCKHAWVVTGIAEIDDELMETHGHLDLACSKCGTRAQLQRPTYYECYMTAKGWLRGEETCFTDSASGDDRLVIVLEGARADDLLTAGDDDQIDALGTIGWLETAADDWQAHEFDHLDGDAPTSATSGQTSLDDPNAPADQPRPTVADLVDGLDLFEGDDDVPF